MLKSDPAVAGRERLGVNLKSLRESGMGLETLVLPPAILDEMLCYAMKKPS